MPIVAIPFSLGGSVHPHFANLFCRQGEFRGNPLVSNHIVKHFFNLCWRYCEFSLLAKIYIIKLPWILPGPDAKYVSRKNLELKLECRLCSIFLVSIGFRILFDLSLSVISSRVPKAYFAIGLYLLVLLHLYCSTLFSWLQLTNCKNWTIIFCTKHRF